jgi:hypothetical protein
MGTVRYQVGGRYQKMLRVSKHWRKLENVLKLQKHFKIT